MRVRAALAQFAPLYLDLGGSIARAIELVERSAREDARLVAFGESWLSGYPAWFDFCPNAGLWDQPRVKELHALMRKHALDVSSPECRALADVARRCRSVVVIGATERVAEHSTLYNCLLVFDADGRLALHHRKLVPTYTERLVWGPGDAEGLGAVGTEHGRLGGLVCWEHWMPLARQAVHDAGEQIHVALWPEVNDAHQLASRHYAFEGRCYVLAVGTPMAVADLPAGLGEPLLPLECRSGFLLRGGSAVYGPRGERLLEPVYDAETLLFVDLDLEHLDRERMTLDVSGHYGRPDLLRLGVQSQRSRIKERG